MKKRLGKIKVITFMILMLALLYCACWYECHYAKDCVVVSVDNDVVAVEDTQGHLWEFIGDDYEVTDVVRVTFYTNHTDTELFDDEIVDVR